MTPGSSNPLVTAAHSPSELHRPAFLMNVPFSLGTEVANNIWMEELDERTRQVDLRRAINQFLQLYHFMAAESVIYLLPTPRLTGLQDLVYCANLGVVLDQAPARNTVVLSRFTAPVRAPETEVGEPFLAAMGYRVLRPPAHFEGEAELKHLHDNVYVGGYGIRSERSAYEWMARELDLEIVLLRETDPHLYHLDCTLFPLTREDTLVCTEMYDREEIAALERVTNIIDVSVDDCYSGICNSVRLGNSLLNASHLHELAKDHPDYPFERQKNRSLEELAVRFGLELSLFNLSEFLKSGALLSCLVMHLNRRSYDLVLT